MKTKILHIASSDRLSGAERVAVGIISNSGLDFEMAYSSPDGEIGDSLVKSGVNWLPMTNFEIAQIKKSIKFFKPDLVHSHDYRASILASLIPGVKVVSHIHCNWPWSEKMGMRNILFLLASIRMAKIMVVSKDILERSPSLRLINIISPHKVIELINSIDVRKVVQSSSENHSLGSFDLVFCGRLTEQKNPSFFIEIVNSLVSQGWRNIHTAILGDGDEREKISNEIFHKGLEKNIIALGFQKNPFPIIADSKLLVMTSKWEGFPMAAIESLALGVPVVSTNVSGIMTLVNNSRGVFVCYSKEEFCEKIKYLLTNDDERLQIGKTAKKWVEGNLDVREYSVKLASIYKSLL